MNFFRYKNTSRGQFVCEIDLSQIYQKDDLKKFWNRYNEFFKADRFLGKVIERKQDKLVYLHKSWIPKLSDHKPKILFLFGNPAPHSVLADIYFAFEGNGREHRFWKVMRELGIINISPRGGDDNDLFKSNFFNLKYDSLFVVGMEVFFTFPSPASDPKWSGVMGLRRLFGKKAFDQLASAERQRVRKVIERFIKQKGSIIAFQKDAYNGLLEKDNRPYNLKRALQGKLFANYTNTILLVGVPPTRWMHTLKFKKVLKKVMALLIEG
ncbi:MAG: hypothetical protein Q8N16_02715 [bacterium]|nr:hypothetical protein [bacterium]